MRKKRNVLWAILLGLALLACALILFLRQKEALAPEPEEETAPPEMTAPGLPEQTAVREDPDAEKLRIVELMIRNKATLPDEDGDFSDWIELENVSGETLNLTGWSLSDKAGKTGWICPALSLAPGERVLIFASGKNRDLHTDFALSGGETLILYTPKGVEAQRVLCPEGESDRAWLPDENGGCTESLYPTPGYPNTAEGYGALMAARTTDSPLIINELSPFNRAGDFSSILGESDWVELKNVSDQPIQLSDYYLSDDEDEPQLFRLPEKTLAPGGLLLLRCDPEATQWGTASVCTAFSLNSTAEQLYLRDAEGRLLDYASIRDVPDRGSFGRMDGENGWFFFAKPSPGRDNSDGARRVSAMPVSLTPDGIYNDVESVTVTLSGAGKIYFTDDSSYPGVASELYDGPILVEKTQVIRAVAVEEDALPSRALTLSFIINENHSLPVLSLVSDDTRFRMMYYDGWKGVEMRGSLSFYEEGGSFTIPCGIKMHGETSLEMAKKNMSVRFRGAYGQAELEYDIFGGGVTCFENLLLRAGQDYYHAIIRNELCTELALQASENVVTTRSRYCVLYLDGKFNGIYALSEKLNESMYAHLAGVSRDSVTVDQPPLSNYHAMYQEVLQYAFENDPADPAVYEELCRRLDMDSLIDWILLEGCFSNSDLSFGNVRYCRSTENDGRWRVMFYDLDAAFYGTDQVFNNLLSDWAMDTRQVAQLIRRLLRNESFRAAMLTRANELFNGPLSNASILAEIDLLAARIDPEVERDYARYNRFKADWEWNVQWLRDFITDNDWQNYCIDQLCYFLDVSEEERILYFGS